jgi:hypothetical protein
MLFLCKCGHHHYKRTGCPCPFHLPQITNNEIITIHLKHKNQHNNERYIYFFLVWAMPFIFKP